MKRNETFSVIRQKGEYQNGYFKKKTACQIFRKTDISYPLIRTSAWGGGECSFFGKFVALCFLKICPSPRVVIRMIKFRNDIIRSSAIN